MWAILFFTMIVFLGLDTQVIILSGIQHALRAEVQMVESSSTCFAVLNEVLGSLQFLWKRINLLSRPYCTDKIPMVDETFNTLLSDPALAVLRDLVPVILRKSLQPAKVDHSSLGHLLVPSIPDRGSSGGDSVRPVPKFNQKVRFRTSGPSLQSPLASVRSTVLIG